MKHKIGFFLVRRLPKRFLSLCALQVLAEATTGKYSNTIVPELSAIEAIQRFSRIHGLKGNGKDEFYDSNRG